MKKLSDVQKKIKDLKDKYYSDEGFERAGFILEDLTLIEIPNISADPENSFLMYPDEAVKYCERAIATWHTHPNGSANLSKEDYDLCFNWPDLYHVVLGKRDSAKIFKCDGETVVNVLPS